MINPIDDGGPAFPCTEGTFDEHGVYFHNGMSLRDYFAGNALAMIVINDVSGRPENFRDFYSRGAYEWADAMIAARNRTP